MNQTQTEHLLKLANNLCKAEERYEEARNEMELRRIEMDHHRRILCINMNSDQYIGEKEKKIISILCD